MIEWLKAWWRGEKRVSGGRGRVFVKRDSGDSIKAKSEPVVTIRARVYRVDKKTWEEV